MTDNRQPTTDNRLLKDLLEEGLAQGVYTAAVLLLGLKGELCDEIVVGRVDQNPAAPLASRDTVFDLASVTKTLATTLAILLLVKQGRTPLDATLGDILSHDWLPPDKHSLTLKSLLSHSSGLPAWQPFYQTVLQASRERRPQELEKLAALEPLAYPPGTDMIYSDLGFMLLKAVVETLAGQDLDTFCREQLYRPLGLTEIGFVPRKHPGGAMREYAATEIGLIPGRLSQGEVHDENAWSAGGIAGHAGLFGRGWEVFHLVKMLYHCYQGNTFFLGPPWLVRSFLTPVPNSTRALGFDTPAAQEASCGRYFSPNSIGHLGFTGTSFWLDLELDQMVVLLTNRVHLGRDNDKIKIFRPRVHEAASKVLGFTKPFRK